MENFKLQKMLKDKDLYMFSIDTPFIMLYVIIINKWDHPATKQPGAHYEKILWS